VGAETRRIEIKSNQVAGHRDVVRESGSQ
jgi:hypothetical protein